MGAVVAGGSQDRVLSTHTRTRIHTLAYTQPSYAPTSGAYSLFPAIALAVAAPPAQAYDSIDPPRAPPVGRIDRWSNGDGRRARRPTRRNNYAAATNALQQQRRSSAERPDGLQLSTQRSGSARRLLLGERAAAGGRRPVAAAAASAPRLTAAVSRAPWPALPAPRSRPVLLFLTASDHTTHCLSPSLSLSRALSLTRTDSSVEMLIS